MNIICKCSKGKCKIPKPFFIVPQIVGRSYKNSERLHKTQTRDTWGKAITFYVFEGSKKAEDWINKKLRKSNKTSKGMYINALIAHLCLHRDYLKLLSEFVKENKVEFDSIKKHIDINIVYRTLNVNIIASDSDMNKIFFSLDEEQIIVKNEIEAHLENVIIPKFKPFNILVYTKFTKNKKVLYEPIGFYSILTEPEISKRDNSLIYEAKITNKNIKDIAIEDKNNLFKVNIKKQIIERIYNDFNNYEKLSKEQIKKLVMTLNVKNQATSTTRKYQQFKRSNQVTSFALYLSKGYCQLCKKIAPFFNKNNTKPFLEIDHIKELANNGADIIENAIALCPNCHSKKTYWDNEKGKKEIIIFLKQQAIKLIKNYRNN